MRSRFAAFAKKEIVYLWRTLHADHEDRARGEAEVLRALKASAGTYRYAGLSILDRRDADESGVAKVLFLARLFEANVERSFVECSDFKHDGNGWRYVSGVLKSVRSIKGDPAALTIDTFPT